MTHVSTETRKALGGLPTWIVAALKFRQFFILAVRKTCMHKIRKIDTNQIKSFSPLENPHVNPAIRSAAYPMTDVVTYILTNYPEVEWSRGSKRLRG